MRKNTDTASEIHRPGMAHTKELWERMLRRLSSAPDVRKSSLARIAAGLRRRKALSRVGRLLVALFAALTASDRAKSRSATGRHCLDYCSASSSKYASANYRRSRTAIAGDYAEKERALREAVKLAAGAGVNYGHQEVDEHVPFVLYFDLPTGQVSFHSNSSFDTPVYPGVWDETSSSREALEAAIREVARS